MELFKLIACFVIAYLMLGAAYVLMGGLGRAVALMAALGLVALGLALVIASRRPPRSP